jgi:hypothetical protein
LQRQPYSQFHRVFNFVFLENALLAGATVIGNADASVEEIPNAAYEDLRDVP